MVSQDGGEDMRHICCIRSCRRKATLRVEMSLTSPNGRHNDCWWGMCDTHRRLLCPLLQPVEAKFGYTITKTSNSVRRLSEGDE